MTAAERFEAALGPVLSWPKANRAIAGGAWEWLLERRRGIAWELFRREPLGCGKRWLGGQLMRLARPFLIAFRRRGFSVALIGPDGAGKTTLARALFEDPQIRARVVYNGSIVNASTVGLPSTRWIERARKDRLAGHGPDGGGLLGAIIYGSRLVEQGYRLLVALVWRLRGRFVVLDRHPYDLLIAELAKGRARSCGAGSSEQPACAPIWSSCWMLRSRCSARGRASTL